MTPEDLEAANLVENPFRVSPGERVRVWAGHHTLRTLLERVVSLVRNDKVGITEFVVLYGELGTGKSHAMRFFETLIAEKATEYRASCVYLPTLRVADRVTFADLYRAILKSVGRPALERFSKALVETVEQEVQALKAGATPEAYREAHAKGERIEDQWRAVGTQRVLETHAARYSVWEQLAKEDDAAWFYVSGAATKLTKDELARLRVTAPIESDFDAVDHLGMLVNLTCRVRLRNNETFWKAFYLFVDELETMIDLEPKNAIGLNQSFRDLVNACPEHLGLVFGMTADAAMIEALFQQALLSRLTREPIEIPSLDAQQAVEFLTEVLKSYRLDPGASDAFHPFTKETIEYVVESTTDKTPRRLFINCRRVLEQAAGEGLLRAGRQVSRADAERFLM